VPRLIRDVAPIHYKVYQHLVDAREATTSPGSFTKRRDVLDFYNYLYSACEGAWRFLKQTYKILRNYDSAAIPRPDKRLARHGDKSIHDRYQTAGDRIKAYRDQLVHDTEFILVNGRIPKRECLSQYLDWGRIEELRTATDWELRLERDFINPLEQATEDLFFLEESLEKVWQVVVREFEEMAHKENYEQERTADLARGVGSSQPGSFVSTDTSSALSGVASFSKSGTVVPTQARSHPSRVRTPNDDPET